MLSENDRGCDPDDLALAMRIKDRQRLRARFAWAKSDRTWTIASGLAQVLLSQMPPIRTILITDIFSNNLPLPAIKTRLPALDERIEWTPRLSYAVRLIRDSHLSSSPAVAADESVNESTSDTYRTDAIGSSALETSEEQAPEFNKTERAWIRAMAQEPTRQEYLQGLVFRIVEEFIADEFNGSAAINEVVVLGPVLDRRTYRALLSWFNDTFESDRLFDATLLQGLVLLIESASPGYLEADDLIRALAVLRRHLVERRLTSSGYLYQITSMVHRLLDVAVDGGVKDLNRVENPSMTSVLDELLESTSPILRFQGSYALQAFQYVSDDEPILQTVLRFSGGVTSVALEVESVCKMDPASLFSGLDSLRQAAGPSYEKTKSILEGVEASPPQQGRIRAMQSLLEGIHAGASHEWYLTLLAARSFVRDGRLADFSRTVCGAHCRNELFFQLGVCQILGGIAMNQLWDDLTRQHAVDFLGALYRKRKDWNQDASVRLWIFAIITQVSELSKPAVRDHALVVLKDLGLGATATPINFSFSIMTQPPLPEQSPLLARVQNTYIESDLQGFKTRRLNEGHQSVYIPPLAKANLQALDDGDLFTLMDKVQEFLASDREVMLILGDSGSGKSTFNRYLERKLWMDYTTNAPIPLFINLPAIDRPEEDLVGKQLRAHGFPDDKIKELKDHRQFVLICDGYDESQLTTNIHTTNQLNRPGHWRVKLIITCRIQHLGANYREQFVPKDLERSHRPADDLFQEAVITPFSKNQIENYIDQYVLLEPRSWSKQDYMDKMTAIPNVMDLVKTPFLLSLVLETLPSVVHNTRDPSRVRVSRVQLYDAFVKHWMGTNKDRLTQNVHLHETSRQALEELLDEGFEQHGILYQQNLAAAIFREQDGRLVVDYTHRQDKDSWKASFFGPEPVYTLLRDASLLNRVDSQFRFIHRSLLEYFFSRFITGPLDDDDLDDFDPEEFDPQALLTASGAPLSVADHPLSWRSLIGEPSIIQFLCDRVQKSPSFMEQLLAIVERSKTDPEASQAAANAVTILFKSGVRLRDFKLRDVRIPGADLSGGELDSAQLQGADLTGVNFSRSWLRQTDFSNAMMSGVQFGEWPFLEVDKEPTACAYSADGDSLAVGLSDGHIIIYDSATWSSTQILSGHTKAVTSLAFSPHEHRRLFSASRDETWGDWDLNTGKPELVPGGHGGVVTSIAVSLDGQQLATGGADNIVRLWNCDTLQQGGLLQGHSDGVTCLAFSPDGSMLASGSNDNTLRLWDTMSGELRWILQGHSDSISSIAFAPNGQQVVSGSHDATVRAWNVSSGEQLFDLHNHSDRVSAVTYSPDGQHIVSASWDRTVRVWNPATHAQVSVLRGATRIITSLSVSPKGLQQVAACSNDKTVRLWDATPSSSDAFSSADLLAEAELSGHTAGISTMAISPDGQRLATGGFDTTIRTCDASTGDSLGPPLCAHARSVAAVAFSPSGQALASASWDHTIRLWDTERREQSEVIHGHLASVTSLAFLPSGQFVSGSADWTVRLWDIESRSSTRLFKGHTRGVRSVACSPDGSRIASGSEDHTVRVWKLDVRFGDHGVVFKGHGDVVACVTFSPTGHQIASASEDKTIRLWDPMSPASEPTVLHGHQGGVQCVAYSSCGKFLASGGDDNKARVWNASSGNLLAVIGDVFGGISSIVWRRSELGFVIGCKDGSIRAWKLWLVGDEAQVQLEWGTGFGHLVATNACIDGAIGLSKVAFDLLKQRGGIGEMAVQSDVLLGRVEE